MKKGLWIFILLAFHTSLFASNFIVCKGKYALCTKALCVPVDGKKDIVSCQCDVKTGYSAATEMCQPVQKTKEGTRLYSRYYPIKNYVTCSNDRPWAWCLDKPCTIDKKNPAKANCACNVVSNQGKYIIVTNKNTESTCKTGIYSSATIEEVTQMNDFLKTQPNLKPLPITVYEGK